MAMKKLKKGMYFTIDSIIAGGIILIVIMLASSSYIKEQQTAHLNYLSQDLIKILSALTVKEANNEYLNSLIASNDITNSGNTILEQISEFWAKNTADGMEMASKSFSNVTEPFVPNIIGFGLWIDNETIYKRNIPVKKSLVSSKKIISGIKKGKASQQTREKPPTLWGPVIAEVRVWD